jgi:hypothetical protein
MSWYNDLVRWLDAPAPAWIMIAAVVMLVRLGMLLEQIRDKLGEIGYAAAALRRKGGKIEC